MKYILTLYFIVFAKFTWNNPFIHDNNWYFFGASEAVSLCQILFLIEFIIYMCRGFSLAGMQIH